MKTEEQMAEISYTITEELGSFSSNSSGWSKELNLISWNGRDVKYDIRDWSPDHAKMGKGITLTKEELIKLRDLLNEIEL